jgi:transposase-like protein
MKLTKDFVRGLNVASLASEKIHYEQSLPECRYCHTNKSVVLYGHNRHNIQRYLCKRCQKVFMANDNLPQMRYSARQVGELCL